MPDPINMSQEDQDRLAAEMRGGISQGPLANQAIEAQNIANANQAVTSSDTPVGGSVIPQATTTVGQNIDQTVNPGGVSAQDLATIQQAKSLYTPAQQIPVTPTPSNAALMPTLNQPINVGTSSGQIIGSHGVYVDPGFVAPWGAMMQRQAAQDQQTNLALKQQQLAKQARDKAFKFEKPKFEVKDPGFQKNLNETATSTINSYVDQAKELGGKDWQVMLKTDTRLGREFQSAMDGLNVVARNADLMTEKFAEIKAGIKDGSTYYDPGVLEAFREYEQAMGRFEKGDVKALGGMRQKLQRIDGEMELNNFLSDSGILTNVVAEVTGRTGISGMQDFMQLKTTSRKSYDKNINAMVENVRKAKGLDSSYTDADIRTALEGHFQNTSKSKKSLKSKPKGGRGGLKMEDKDIKIQKGGTSVVISSKDAEGKDIETTFNVASRMPVNTVKGGIKSEGIKIVTDQFGGTQEIADIANLNITSFGNVIYQDPEEGKFGDLKYKKIATAEMEVQVPEMKNDGLGGVTPTGNMTTEVRTVQIDAEEAEDVLRNYYGDKVIDAHNKENERLNKSRASTKGPQEGNEQETQEGTAVFRNGTWVLK
jgi:hypothetical protein